MIIQTSSAQQFNSAINNSGTVILDFYASWCGPCGAMSQLLQQLDAQMQGKITILKVDIQMFPELASKFNVKSLPTLYLIKEGRIVNHLLGNPGSVAGLIQGLGI